MRLNKKNSKEFNNLFKLCLQMISNNTETILIEHCLDDTAAALEVKVPFSTSISVLSGCFNIDQIKKYI